MPQINFKKVQATNANSPIRITYNGKRGIEFGSLRELREFAQSTYLTDEQMLAIALRLILRRGSSAIADLQAAEGKTLNIDITTDPWGTWG